MCLVVRSELHVDLLNVESNIPDKRVVKEEKKCTEDICLKISWLRISLELPQSQRTSSWSLCCKALCMPCNTTRSWCVSLLFMCSLCFLSHRFPFPERSIRYCALFFCLLFLILNLLNISSSHFGLCCLFFHAVAWGSSPFVNKYVYSDLFSSFLPLGTSWEG